jgi:hypothetical protein
MKIYPGEVVLMEIKGGRVRRAWGPFENEASLHQFLGEVQTSSDTDLTWKTLKEEIQQRSSQYNYRVISLIPGVWSLFPLYRSSNRKFK